VDDLFHAGFICGVIMDVGNCFEKYLIGGNCSIFLRQAGFPHWQAISHSQYWPKCSQVHSVVAYDFGEFFV
jgi:hypothetical protein